MKYSVSGPSTPSGFSSETRVLRRNGATFGALLLGLGGLFLGTIAGCNGSAGIPNLTQSAAPLEGNASYGGPRMVTPRFGHTSTSLEDGSVLVIGGTDERFLTAVDTAEIFDQSARVDLALPTPESISGDFLDQDIDGDIIALSNGGRFYHTATAIDDNKVIVIGGTDSIFFGDAEENSEIFDPLTRSFDNPDLILDPDDDIITARLLHTADVLPNGKLIVIGGQEFETVVVPGQVNVNGIPTQTQNAYTSVKEIEIFDPATLVFETAVDNNFFAAVLTTPRGRSNHLTVPFAGFDNLLGTGDDVLGIIGGYETLSAESLASPETLIPWQEITTKQTSMDFYFSAGGTVSFAQGLALAHRCNGGKGINLGSRRQTTPSGSFGVSNAALIFGGDSDYFSCPEGSVGGGGATVDLSDLLVGTYTGFGPANGARFTRIDTGAQANWVFDSSPICWPPPILIAFNRSHADGVMIDMVRVRDNQPFIGSVIVTAGGQDQSFRQPCTPTITNSCQGLIEGFTFFDPFFHPDIFEDDIDGDGEPEVFPWQFEEFGTNLNPLGLAGTWVNYDDNIPTGQDLTGYFDPNAEPTVTLNLPRVYHTMTRIPGEDGLNGTIDDRIVIIGGTNEYWPGGTGLGDDALANSCEIFVPPDAGSAP